MNIDPKSARVMTQTIAAHLQLLGFASGDMILRLVRLSLGGATQEDFLFLEGLLGRLLVMPSLDPESMSGQGLRALLREVKERGTKPYPQALEPGEGLAQVLAKEGEDFAAELRAVGVLVGVNSSETGTT